MIEFLKEHERYWTMNSWNRSSSYANNVKIYNLGMDKDLEIKAYGLLAEEGFIDLLASDYEFLKEQFSSSKKKLIILSVSMAEVVDILFFTIGSIQPQALIPTKILRDGTKQKSKKDIISLKDLMITASILLMLLKM